MSETDLITAFDECITRIHAGESVEACLRDYPAQAPFLRPMLEAAAAVRRAAPVTPAAARMRVGARVQQAAAAIGYVQPRRGFGVPRLALAAAVLAVVLLAGGIALRLRDDRSSTGAVQLTPIPSATLTPTTAPSATETSAPTLTPTASLTPTPSLTVSATPSLTATQTATASATSSATRTPTPSATHTPTRTLTATPTPTAAACRFTVTVQSANLREGPGTGYSIVGFALSGDQFTAIGRHSSGLWFQVRTPARTAWIAASTGSLSGACAILPLLDAPLIGGQPTATTAPAGSGPTPIPGGAPATPVPAPPDSGDDNDNDDNNDDDDDGDDGDDGDDD